MARKPKLSPCPDPDPALSKAIRQYRVRLDRFMKTILGTTTSPADLSHLTSMDDRCGTELEMKVRRNVNSHSR